MITSAAVGLMKSREQDADLITVALRYAAL